MRVRALLIACAVVCSLLAAPPASAAFGCDYITKPEEKQSDDRILYTENLGLASGRYVLPADPEPKQLVVMFHGYQQNTCAWRNHLRAAADRGAVAVAMDYTGQDPVTNRGWFMRSAAADSIAAARHLIAQNPSIREVFAMAPSLGANAAGVTLAHPDAVRADGSPLFDYLVAAEGVHNLTEQYTLAYAVQDHNATAKKAVVDIEAEAGGSLAQRPDAYSAMTNVAQAPKMSYLKGAILLHGLDDGTVPYNQSREMAAALRAVGVNTELHTILGRGNGKTGTLLSNNLMGPIWSGAGQGSWSEDSPTVGHGWEGDSDHQVIKLSFDALWRLMQVGETRSTYVEHIDVSLPPPLP
ncbi:MAG TPA: prolyl oligopeptidase family serine peptidase [Actinomycetota bacterium]|nr:prolyl oligopeptidase family serine peptidase [Actinomycetota bacterium]